MVEKFNGNKPERSVMEKLVYRETEMTLPVRKASVADVDAIVDLIAGLAVGSGVIARSKEDIAEKLQTFSVWEEDGRIVGCCALEVYSKRLAEVRSLAVRDDCQNRGVGTRLVQTCVLEARERGIDRILAITDRVGLFAMAGFSKEVVGKQALLFTP